MVSHGRSRSVPWPKQAFNKSNFMNKPVFFFKPLEHQIIEEEILFHEISMKFTYPGPMSLYHRHHFEYHETLIVGEVTRDTGEQ